MDRVKRIWYLSPMRAAKVQASLRIRAVSAAPSLLAHTSSESRGTFRQKARSLAPLNGWACAVKICHDGMLEDTNSLDGAHIIMPNSIIFVEVHGDCRAWRIGQIFFSGSREGLSYCFQNHNKNKVHSHNFIFIFPSDCTFVSIMDIRIQLKKP